jgi:phosphoribosylamine--glycine ligase
MKLLIVDQDGMGLSFACRAAQAGHEVRWFVRNADSINPDMGRGFKDIQKVYNWIASVRWADLIFPTSNCAFMPQLTKLMREGYPIFGPTTQSAALEINRGEGLQLLAEYGIESAPYQTFKSFKDAYRHVESTTGRFVFKTLGDEEDKSLTYVSKGPADMLAWLEQKMKTSSVKGEVMLQEFVEGIELGVSRFMGGRGFVGPYNESFEHKKLMSGNYGPNTGEMGTVAYFTKESKLGEETLGKLEYALLDRGHRGDVALGFMIDKQGVPRPNEWTVRPGWPIWHMMAASVRDDPCQWMLDALNGVDSTSFKEDIGACIVVGTPPMPNRGDAKERANTTGKPIYGVTNGNRKHLNPVDVMLQPMPDMEGDKLVRRPMWCTSGCYNVVVTGFGRDVKQATERAYKTTKQLHVSNMLVRDDVGEKLKETLPILHNQGFALHCEYGT